MSFVELVYNFEANSFVYDVLYVVALVILMGGIPFVLQLGVELLQYLKEFQLIDGASTGLC